MTDPRRIISHLELIRSQGEDYTNVPLTPLLEVFAELRKLISILGYLFDMAMSDITTKCDYVRETVHKANIEQATVEMLIVHEKALNTDAKVSAVRKLLPLIRALEFVAILLQNLQGPSELGVAIRDAYWKTISRHHGYMVQGGVVTATYAAPYKAIFFQQLNLGTAVPSDYCAELSKLLSGLFQGLKTLCIREQCWQ